MQNTNTIENVHTTREEIADALDAAMVDGPHKRLSELAKLFLGLSGEGATRLDLPQTLNDIRNIYDQVMDGELKDICKPDGMLFRAKTVSVYDGAGRLIHKGAWPESEIQVQLTKWLALLSNENPAIVAGHDVLLRVRMHTPVLRWQRQNGTVPARPAI